MKEKQITGGFLAISGKMFKTFIGASIEEIKEANPDLDEEETLQVFELINAKEGNNEEDIELDPTNH